MFFSPVQNCLFHCNFIYLIWWPQVFSCTFPFYLIQIVKEDLWVWRRIRTDRIVSSHCLTQALFVPVWRSFPMVVQPMTGSTTFWSNVGLYLISLTVRYCAKYFKLNVPHCNFKFNVIVQSTMDMENIWSLSLFAMAFYVSGN